LRNTKGLALSSNSWGWSNHKRGESQKSDAVTGGPPGQGCIHGVAPPEMRLKGGKGAADGLGGNVRGGESLFISLRLIASEQDVVRKGGTVAVPKHHVKA